MVAEPLQRGERRERDRRRLLERQVRGLPVDRLARDHVLGERAAVAAVYLVAGREAVHAAADRLDDAGEVAAESLDFGFRRPINGRAT